MKCSCGKRPVFFRKYEGTYLCKYCFCRSVEKKIKKTIRRYEMIKSGDKIAVGFSGGKDSSIALHLMDKILKPRRDIEFFAITIDEGIAGYRPDNLKNAKELCKKLGIKHHVFSFKKELGKTLDQKVREVKRYKTLSLKEFCTYCGVGRRYVLNKKARDLHATKLCVGHNLDDESQGVLMNYIRGDLFRASRYGPVTDYSTSKKRGNLFIPRIKPLREIPERETALYTLLKGFKLSWKKCPYRSGIRLDVKEIVSNLENKYPGMRFSILETFDKVLPNIRKSIKYKESEIKKCKKCGEPGSGEICKTCELWK